jgi:hypothetical protein
MPAVVGGRIEAVAPRRSLFGPDYVRLAILLIVAAIIHCWLIAHTSIPARDSLGFARLALNIGNPNAGVEPSERELHPRQRIEVIRTAEQPPGYPLAVWAMEKALRSTALPLPDRGLLATQIANAIAAVLMVVPLYLIGRILFDRDVGFASALLFQVLPVPARVTSDGLSEGFYLLVVVVAILLGVRAARRPGIGAFLLCGLATGASYLVRPEGLLVGIAVGGVIAWAGLMRYWPRDIALGRLTALAVGLALVAVPYMLLIGKLTNKPTGGTILNILERPAPIWNGQPGAQAPRDGVISGPLFAEWWDPKKDDGKCRELWAVAATFKEVTKGLHYSLIGFAIFGLLAHRRQLFSPDLGMWVLVLLGCLSCGLLMYLATRIGYVSERHTVLFVMLSCIFASAALKPLAEFLAGTPVLGKLILWPRALPAVLLATLVLTALPFTLKPLHPQREGHKHAGKWLAEHMQPEDWLVDPFAWGEWYAGRTLYRTTEYRGQPSTTWVIVEEGKTTPHSRLPQWEHAQQLKARGEAVFEWHAATPGDETVAVKVYKVVTR